MKKNKKTDKDETVDITELVDEIIIEEDVTTPTFTKIDRPKLTKASRLMKNSGFKRASEIAAPEYIPTGSWQFDNARGLEHAKGFRKGSTVVIYGSTGAGKSTMVYQMIGYWQSLGLVVALLNLEDSFDPEWAALQGVDVDALFMTEVPEFADVAMQQTLDALEGKYFDVLVTDSMHAVGMKREIKRDDTLEKEKPVAALAGKVTQFLRVAKPFMYESKTVHVIIGHARINLDAGPMARGPQLLLTGGEHLHHESNDIFQVTKSKSKTRAPWVNDKLIGHAMGVNVEKTRGPGIHSRFDEIFITGKGFSEAWSTVPKILADKNAAVDVFQQAGNHYKWTDGKDEEQKFNGKGKLLAYFDNNKEEVTRLQKAYDENSKTQAVPESTESVPVTAEE